MSPEVSVLKGRTFESVLHGQEPPFLAGGFECSTHRRANGVRLDLLEATRHAKLALADYEQLASLDIHVARDGVRWHLIEKEAGQLRLVDCPGACRRRSHGGRADHLGSLPLRVARSYRYMGGRFRGKIREFRRQSSGESLCAEFGSGQAYCPINEISYVAWAGGEVGRMNPCATRRGAELKRILVQAAIAATRAVRSIDAKSVFICAEPLIHVAASGGSAAEKYRLSQFEALDMLLGLRNPELGGGPDIVDLVGLNFYPDNQWFYRGSTIPMGHHAYRPLGDMLAEVHARYGKPLFIAETGAEGRARSYWLNHVTEEVLHALEQGVPILGVCLYPVLDYPGWENGRLCNVGLLSEADRVGRRAVYGPMLREVRRAQGAFGQFWTNRQRVSSRPPLEPE